MALPGMSLSILRQSSAVKAGEGLVISGRCTAFGIGLPAFIRVYVEGPSYNPDIRSFNTVSALFTGNYNVSVMADKDGEYEVYAKAFPIPALPTGTPFFPEDLAIGPTLAESTKPPIVVGNITDSGVVTDIAEGQKQLVQAPQLTPIEVSVAAPITSIQVGAAEAAVPTVGYPTGQVQVPVSTPDVTQRNFKAGDISVTPSVSPSQIEQGGGGVLNLTIGNVSPVSEIVKTEFTLEGPATLKLASPSVSVYSQRNTPYSHPFSIPSDTPTGTYNLRTRVTSITGSTLIDTASPSVLRVLPMEVPVAPEVVTPEIPKVPTVEEVIEELPMPTMNNFGMAQTSLPSSIEAGKRLSGSVIIPYSGPTLPLAVKMSVLLYAVSRTATSSQTRQFPLYTGTLGPPSPGSALTIPVNTTIPQSAVPGMHDVMIDVHYSGKDIIDDRDIGDLLILERPTTTTPTLELPSLSDFDNLRKVNLNLSTSQITQGETLTGSLSVPYGGPAVPLSVNLIAKHAGSTPSGNIGQITLVQKSISSGKPISFNFSKMISTNMAPGNSDIFLQIASGNQIIAYKDIGNLNILEKVTQAVAQAVEAPSRGNFGIPSVSGLPSGNKISPGETLRATMKIPYKGPTVSSPLVVILNLTKSGKVTDNLYVGNVSFRANQDVSQSFSKTIPSTRETGKYDFMMEVRTGLLGGESILSRDIGDLNIIASGIKLPSGQLATPSQVLSNIKSAYSKLQNVNDMTSAIAARSALFSVKSTLPSEVFNPLATAAHKLVYVHTYAQPYAYGTKHPSGWPELDNLPSGFRGEAYIYTGAGWLNKLASLGLAEKVAQLGTPSGVVVDDIKGTANGVDVKFHLSASKGYQLPSLNSITSLIPGI